MYYPYFRGKQFELISLRESSELIAESKFVPIIEPVRASLGGLQKALDSLADSGAQAVVIVNPQYGDYCESGKAIEQLLQERYGQNDAIRAGVLLTPQMDVNTVLDLTQRFDAYGTTLIHAGFTDSRFLSEHLVGDTSRFRNVFLADQASHLYRRHFQGKPRILVRDGFIQRKNADYPSVESFSDLHITYQEQGMDGYGDFLTVGENYSDRGGPAYAVAIHLTFIDPDQDDAMFVYHFKSDTNDTPLGAGSKFLEALKKLIALVDSGNSKLDDTSALREFQELYDQEHFPGLGYVKKLSIRHHLETLANYQLTHSRNSNG